jgi:hypothetical protein
LTKLLKFSPRKLSGVLRDIADGSGLGLLELEFVAPAIVG